ncbi:MAG: hypothetical protein HZC36_05150 [Armatimonadetes bacterium]|nr:hypothetical protein [Armatimonadota bacterium]
MLDHNRIGAIVIAFALCGGCRDTGTIMPEKKWKAHMGHIADFCFSGDDAIATSGDFDDLTLAKWTLSGTLKERTSVKSRVAGMWFATLGLFILGDDDVLRRLVGSAYKVVASVAPAVLQPADVDVDGSIVYVNPSDEIVLLPKGDATKRLKIAIPGFSPECVAIDGDLIAASDSTTAYIMESPGRKPRKVYSGSAMLAMAVDNAHRRLLLGESDPGKGSQLVICSLDGAGVKRFPCLGRSVDRIRCLDNYVLCRVQQDVGVERGHSVQCLNTSTGQWSEPFKTTPGFLALNVSAGKTKIAIGDTSGYVQIYSATSLGKH